MTKMKKTGGLLGLFTFMLFTAMMLLHTPAQAAEVVNVDTSSLSGALQIGDSSKEYVVTTSSPNGDSVGIDIRDSVGGSVFNVVLKDVKITGKKWTSGIVIYNAGAATTTVNLYLEGTNSIVGDNWEGLVAAKGNAKINIASKSKGTVEFSSSREGEAVRIWEGCSLEMGVNVGSVVSGAEVNGVKYSTINEAFTKAQSEKPFTITAEAHQTEVTKFSSGIYTYKVISKDNTVAVTGFVKGKYTSKVNIGKTTTYKGKTYKVTEIADKAFYKNTKIKQINIGNNVTKIGKDAFKGCTKLTDAVIGNKVKTIGSAAFYKCTSLRKVTLGSSVREIGSHVFCHDTKMKDIVIKSSKLTKLGKHNLYNLRNVKIKVPSSKVKAYTKLFKNQGQKSGVKVIK